MPDDLSFLRNETSIAERAFAQADKLGLKLNAVRVRDAGPVHAALGIGYLAGVLTVSKRAAEELSDDELEFAMTFAMAITPGVMMGYMALVMGLCVASVWLIGQQLGWLTITSLAVGFGIGIVLVTLTSYRNLRNEQRRRLRKALGVTKDPTAARSYLERFNAANAQVLKGKGPDMMRRAAIEDLHAITESMR